MDKMAAVEAWTTITLTTVTVASHPCAETHIQTHTHKDDQIQPSVLPREVTLYIPSFYFVNENETKDKSKTYSRCVIIWNLYITYCERSWIHFGDYKPKRSKCTLHNPILILFNHITMWKVTTSIEFFCLSVGMLNSCRGKQFWTLPLPPLSPLTRSSNMPLPKQ